LCEPIKGKIRKVFLENNGEQYREALKQLNAIRFAPVSDENYKLMREILRATP
jgi:hypothetical protein